MAGDDRENEVEERRRRILGSPTYRRADADPELLDREELRPIRLAVEYLKPHLGLREAGVRATIVAFGSTRIVEPGEARRRVERLRAEVEAHPGDPERARRLAVAERILAKCDYYEVAREFGRIVGRCGEGPRDSRLVVVTGGGPGLMEAVNRGAAEVGADSVGLNITLPHEQPPNPWITPRLAFRFRYFALRKLHFALRARALVAFPGGYGTLDELFGTLCLLQTGKLAPLPVVLVGEDYWRRVFDVDYLVAEGAIDPEDLDLFTWAETAEEIWNAIQEWYERTGGSLFGDGSRLHER